MGDTTGKLPEKVTVDITADCPGEIAEVVVFRNNEPIFTADPEGTTFEKTFTDTEPRLHENGTSWYYVRVRQADEEIAWTSPVWFGVE